MSCWHFSFAGPGKLPPAIAACPMAMLVLPDVLYCFLKLDYVPARGMLIYNEEASLSRVIF